MRVLVEQPRSADAGTERRRKLAAVRARVDTQKEALGARAEPTPDGMRVTGGSYHGGQVASRGDHRVAMAFAVAGLRAATAVTVTDCANVATSFPGFVELARTAGLKIRAN